jgi:hypothetical protein
VSRDWLIDLRSHRFFLKSFVFLLILSFNIELVEDFGFYFIFFKIIPTSFACQIGLIYVNLICFYFNIKKNIIQYIGDLKLMVNIYIYIYRRHDNNT